VDCWSAKATAASRSALNSTSREPGNHDGRNHGESARSPSYFWRLPRRPGSNAGDYATNADYVFGLNAGDPGSPYAGWYFTSDLVFEALAATPDYGGPEAQAAAL
jgi:hypothetical protein